MMSVLYDVSIQNVGQHIKKIFADSELDRGATIKKYFIVQNEGAREVSREVEHYNLRIPSPLPAKNKAVYLLSQVDGLFILYQFQALLAALIFSRVANSSRS